MSNKGRMRLRKCNELRILANTFKSLRDVKTTQAFSAGSQCPGPMVETRIPEKAEAPLFCLIFTNLWPSSGRFG